LDALGRGIVNLEHHIHNVKQFGVPVVVAVNRFTSDSDAELQLVIDTSRKAGVRVALNEVWARGGEGGEDLARQVLEMLATGGAQYAPIYDETLPIRQKVETIACRVYGADGVDFAPKADRNVDYLESVGLGQTPICIAKTQYS